MRQLLSSQSFGSITCRALSGQAPVFVFLTCTLGSVISASVLAIHCLKLWPKHNGQLLLRLLLCIAAADIGLGVGGSLLPIMQLLFRLEHMSDLACAADCFVTKFLLMVSVSGSFALAVTLLLQVKRLPTPRWLRWAPLLALPVSVVLSLPTLIWPANSGNHFGVLCFMPPEASLASAIEITIIAIAFIVIHVVVLAHGAQSRPHSITRRSVAHASRYLFAFLLTYTLYVVYHMAKIFARSLEDLHDSCIFRWLRLVAFALRSMNGVFNLWAFLVHCRRMQMTRCSKQAVSFRGAGSLVEVKEIPRGSCVAPQALRAGAWFRFCASAERDEWRDAKEDASDEVGSFLVCEAIHDDRWTPTWSTLVA
jgi:hypothetical protein